MEWAVLGVFAVIASALIARPLPGESLVATDGPDAFEETYDRLLRQLRDLDDDADAGRLTFDERAEARRALAPELRAVTEALRASGSRLRAVSGERAR